MWRQELNRAQRGIREARKYLQRILDEQPRPGLAAVYVAQIAQALAEVQDAVGELERIGGGEKEES